VATIPLLAEQLAEDLHEQHVDAWDEHTDLLIATACEILLSYVDWQQAVERLVEHVAGAPEPLIAATGNGQEKSQAG
jgi:hypothetical protein